jgi:hypothetical protein
MAHFAKIQNNLVTQVVVVHNNELLVDGVESEHAGISFLQNLYGQDTAWVQTSFNKTFRKNFAGVGFSYDEEKNAFIAPKPFASWILDEGTCQWVSSVPEPTFRGNPYVWDEETLSWVEVKINPNPTPVEFL